MINQNFDAINKSLKYKLYISMGWKFYFDPDRKDGQGFWLPPEKAAIKTRKVVKNKNAVKKRGICCVCGGCFNKKKMNLREYASHRIKNGKVVKVVNKKYECARCAVRNNKNIK
jgi:hypothetical protein